MRELYIYPNTRSLKKAQERLLRENRLLPTLTTIDEFEKSIIILNRVEVDTLKRVLYLQEASKFSEFRDLKINRELIKFFTRSEAILKFFEELQHERVTFNDLLVGDTYAEFNSHIEILKQLFLRYKKILHSHNLTDRAFIPDEYILNSGYIKRFERIELFLEGYLTRFELELIDEVSKEIDFIIHLQTSEYNQKVQERFREFNIDLPKESFVSFNFRTKEILKVKKNSLKIDSKVVSVEERVAQVAILFEEIESMVRDGIKPNNIVIVLPDEHFKDILKRYDRFNNLNFAMGFDYAKTKTYKQLEAIYNYWQDFEIESKKRLIIYGIDLEKLNGINPNEIVDIEKFFKLFSFLDLDLENEKVINRFEYFKRTLKEVRVSIKNWLFLWLRELIDLKIDDTDGGKVTVIGALESRGVEFEGVIIVDFNDGFVPTIPAKDMFLNSNIRKLAKLPTRADREAHQKQLYKRLLERAKRSLIIYSRSSNRAPALYLYELGLNSKNSADIDLKLLYRNSIEFKEVEPTFNLKDTIWSANRLKIFLECKRRYYYQYILKLRERGDIKEFNEGHFIHRVLDELFKQKSHFKNSFEMQKALNITMDRLYPERDPKLKYIKLLWQKRLEPFIQKQIEYFKSGYRVIETEKRIEGEILGLKFNGIIDRVDRDGDNINIFDYKTGSIKEQNRVKNLERLTDFQMSIYYELLKERYYNLNLAFIEIPNGNIAPITKLKEKNGILYSILDNLKKIDTIQAKKCEDVSKCTYCQFQLHCQRGEFL